jgi:uncharacterized protein
MVTMPTRARMYDTMIAEHLSSRRQMMFVSGPRQVGKTTTCRGLSTLYLNWDNNDHRAIISAGPAAVVREAGLETLATRPPVILFDELHKYRRWKTFLKGFFDTYEGQVRVLVTGSSRLDVYRRGGDSLMGRYFHYRMHPFSVAEIARQDLPDARRIVRPPRAIAKSEFAALWEHGGYPEPFLTRKPSFTRQWQRVRRATLLREDLRDLTKIHELGQIEHLAGVLQDRSGEQLIYSNLAEQVRVSVDTIRRWLDTLCGLYFGFRVQPWFKNVSRSLRKEPKWFLRDWSGVADEGKRAETFVACHLLKAVEGWTDLGLGDFQLGYLRDKSKREVDFIVIRDRQPWFLVEVKKADGQVSTSPDYFQKQIKAPFAFQVVIDADYIDADCFARPRGPMAVPARTFLSQLM